MSDSCFLTSKNAPKKPRTIPVIINHGDTPKCRSAQTPNNVHPIEGTNIRHVVSPIVANITPVCSVSGAFWSSETDCLLSIAYIIPFFTVYCLETMPRKNYPKKRQKTLHIASPTPDIASTLYVACREKRRFPTEKQALHDAETRMLGDITLELTVYRCAHCQGWHLTRRLDD